MERINRFFSNVYTFYIFLLGERGTWKLTSKRFRINYNLFQDEILDITNFSIYSYICTLFSLLHIKILSGEKKKLITYNRTKK